MQQFLQQVVSGLASGGIYASLALALVLIYRSTEVINFAQGEMATFTTFVAWQLIDWGVPYWVAFFLTLAFAFVFGVVVERVVIRPFEHGPVLTVVIVTIGLLVLLNGLNGWIWGAEIKSFMSAFPTRPINIGGVAFSLQDIGIIAVALLAVCCLWLFFRFTKVGLAMRAAALNPDSARLAGVRVGWMLALGWGLAAMLGALVGADDRADRVPRPEHDADRPALRLRGRGARRAREPGRRGRRRPRARRDAEPARHLRRIRSRPSCACRSRWPCC